MRVWVTDEVHNESYLDVHNVVIKFMDATIIIPSYSTAKLMSHTIFKMTALFYCKQYLEQIPPHLCYCGPTRV